MNANWQTCLIFFALLLVHYEATAPTTQNFCDVSDGDLQDGGPLYVHDKDEYIKLHDDQILLDMKTSIQDDGHNAYSWFLQINTGDAAYTLRVIKTGISGEPVFSDTVPTGILAAADLSTDNINDYFLGAQSRFIALEQGSNIKFYWINATSNLQLAQTFVFETETFVKIVAGADGATAKFLTRTNGNKTKLYTLAGATSAPLVALQSSSQFSSSDQFVFACPVGFLWIDGSANNNGITILKLGNSPGFADSIAITGTAPTIQYDGTPLNYDVNVLDFEKSYFVAMHQEDYKKSVLFYIKDVDNAPAYAITENVAAGNEQVNSYYSDQNSNYLLVTTNAGVALAAHLYFVDSYAATRLFKYSPTSIAGPDNDILEDLSLTGLDALQVSFSYINGDDEDYYNIFILQVETGSLGETNIIRYFYDATLAPAGQNVIPSGAITRHFTLSLSEKTNSLFRDKLDQVQIMTFEYACTCSVFQISEFICFGASLECTLAVQNQNTDCTVEATEVQTNV